MDPLDFDYEIADDDYYLFAAAELSAREEELVEEAKLKRMVSVLNIKEFLKILRETYYSKHMDLLEEGKGFDKVVQLEFKSYADYLLERLKEEHLVVLNILFIPEEVHNYKLITKAMGREEDLKGLFVRLRYSYNEIMDAAKGDKNIYMDSLTQSMALQATKLLEKDIPFRQKEIELEKTYLEMLWKEVEKIPVRMIVDYFKSTIDMYNIKNIYRRWLAKDKADVEEITAGHGFLGDDYYNLLKREGIEEFFKEVEKTRYKPLVSKAGELLTEHKDYSDTEKCEDIFYRVFFEPARFTTNNLEKIFDFFLKKKLEAKTLNIIHNGILYGMDKDRLRHEVLIFNEDKDRSNR